MSKIILTKKEMEYIQATIEQSPVHHWLSVKDKNTYEIDDVVIKMTHHWQTKKFEPEKVTNIGTALRKFRVVYIDDYGVPYIKRINANGKLSEVITPMCTLDPRVSYYAFDPDLAEHIILSDDPNAYNPNAAFKNDKKARSEIRRKNEKLRENTKTGLLANAVLDTLNVNDKFWYVRKGYDSEAYDSEYIVTKKTSIRKDKIAGNDLGYHESRQVMDDKNIDNAIDIVIITMKSSTNAYNERKICYLHAAGGHIYKTKPLSYESKI